MRFQVRLLGASAVFAGVLSLAACSSAASQPTAASTTPVATSSSADGSAPPSSASAGPSPSPTGVQNLVLTDAIRAQLVAAGAALNGLPASDYTGLVKGESYYGFDPATSTYWAEIGRAHV